MLIAVPFYAATCWGVPGYAAEFFGRHTLSRYAGETFGSDHGFPGVAYIPILLGALLPWTIYLPGACIRLFPRRWRLRNADPGVLFLWLAALLPLIFFMFSKTKLPVYILPVVPPLAVLMGHLASRWVQSDPRDGLLTHGAIAMMVAIACFVLLLGGLEYWLGALSEAIVIPATGGAAVITAMIVALRRGRRGWVMILASAGVMGCFMYLIIHTAAIGYEMKSMRGLARRIDPADAGRARFYYWTSENRSFEYYADAPIEQLKKPLERHKARVREAMLSDEPVYFFVTGREYLTELVSWCPNRTRELGGIGRRWLVTNRRDTSPATQPASTPAPGAR